MLNIILSLVFALSGALLILLSGIIFRENPRGRINRVTALMLLFAGIAPVLATIYYAIILPSGREFSPYVYNLFFVWELFFPSLILFTAIFPVEHRYYRKYPRLFYAAFIPHIAHLILVMLFADPNAMISAVTLESNVPILGLLLEYVSYFLKLIIVIFALALDVHVRFFSIINLLYVIIATVFLLQGLRSVINPRIRNQVRIIAYGISTAVGLYAIAYIIPGIFNIQISPQIQYLMIIIGLLVGPGFIAWAILKHRFLDIRLIVRQSLVYSLSSAIVIGGYLLIMNRFGRILQSIFGAGIAVLEVGILIIALLFFQPVLNFIDGLLRRLFIKGGADFRVVLENFSTRIITLLEFDKLVEETLKTFRDDLLIENVFLCIPPASGECILYMADDKDNQTIKKDRVLESFLVVRESPITRDEVPSPALSPTTRKLFKDYETQILIPLISSHRLLGYISLGKKVSGLGYNTEDLTVFRVLANQLVIAVSNARLYRESLENQRLEEELALARRIQQQLLPEKLPSSERLQFTAFSEPSREVGGDYYDFISTHPNRLAFGIGDASGKGIPASLLIARMQAILHSVAKSDLDVHLKITHINNVLLVSGMPESYVTFFYGEVDTDNLLFNYCNAGHNYPLLLRDNGDFEYLQEGGLILGAFGNASYDSASVQLRSGDLLVCYTDGITEAMNKNDVEFGEERLKELLITNQTLALNKLQQTILDDVKKYCGQRPIQDDCTMLMMRVL